MKMWETSSIPSTPGNSQLKNIYDSSIVTDSPRSAIQTNPKTAPLISNEFQKFEKYRLDSFKTWSSSSGIDPKKLAKAGFFSTGVKDEVQCFTCGGVISSWKFNDVAIVKHKENFPNCQFILGKSDNVPLNAISTVINHRRQDSNKIVNKTNNRSDNANTANNSDMATTSIGPVNNYHQQIGSYKIPKFDVVDDPHRRTNAPVDFEKLKNEGERLKTFKSGWPIFFIKPEELAKAGFYYTLTSDKVQCVFCFGIVGHWDRGDNPLREHARHFPMCPFLLNYDVGNIPIGGSPRDGSIRQRYKGEDVVGHSGAGSSRSAQHDRGQFKDATLKNNYDELGVINQSVKAKYPAQAVLDVRVRSYNNPEFPWPKNAPVSAEALAQAGFFYTGVSDSTRCFHCNGGLTNWVKGDDPWTEHARWFPKCNYVKLNKGDEFISEARSKYPPVINKNEQPLNSGEDDTSKIAMKIEELMSSPIVLEVLDMGISDSIIRRALLEKLSSSGSMFASSAQLFNAAGNVMIGDQSSATNMPPEEEQRSEVQPMAIEEMESLDIPMTVKQAAAEKGTDLSVSGLTLEEENRVLKEQTVCKVCMDNPIGVVFLPCGHFICCPQCAPALQDCPVCRKTIKGTVRTFLS